MPVGPDDRGFGDTTEDTLRVVLATEEEMSQIPVGPDDRGAGPTTRNTLRVVLSNDSPNTGGGGNIPEGEIRERLTADRTYYVATTGNDSNDGLTMGSPMATIQKAWDTICDTLDLAGFRAIIQLADGTYTQGLISARSPAGAGGTFNSSAIPQGGVVIQGNTGSDTAVVIHVSSPGNTAGHCFCFSGNAGRYCGIFLKHMRLRTSGTGASAIFANMATWVLFEHIDFGACVRNHVDIGQYAQVICNTAYSISGGALTHVTAYDGYYSNEIATCTITGTPAFSVAFANVDLKARANFQDTIFTGSATGKRYIVDHNAIIHTNDGGETFLPGSTLGERKNGGMYDNTNNLLLTLTSPMVATGGTTPSLQVGGTSFTQASIGIFAFSATAATSPVFYFSRSKSGTLGVHSAVASGDRCGAHFFAGSDGTNFVQAGQIRVEVDGTVSSGVVPGKMMLLTANTAGSVASHVEMRASGSTVLGKQAALATNATGGFAYIPTCAGVPTGVPESITGMAPMVIDTTNNRLYMYTGGAWRSVGATT